MQHQMRGLLLPLSVLVSSFLGWQQITAGILQGLGRTVIPMMSIFVGLLVKAVLDYQLTGTSELGINGGCLGNQFKLCHCCID